MDPSSTSANAEAAMSGAGGVPTGQSREGLGGNGAKVRQCCFSFVCGKKTGVEGRTSQRSTLKGGEGVDVIALRFLGLEISLFSCFWLFYRHRRVSLELFCQRNACHAGRWFLLSFFTIVTYVYNYLLLYTYIYVSETLFFSYCWFLYYFISFL